MTGLFVNKIPTNIISIHCVTPLTINHQVDKSELSHQKTKLTAQTRTLTAGVRQFIKDRLAEILAAEHQGSLPGDPTSLPKGKCRRPSDDNEDPEKELAARMITLVEVRFRIT